MTTTPEEPPPPDDTPACDDTRRRSAELAAQWDELSQLIDEHLKKLGEK
ncbi:hypothetical protein [Streptomyces radicis]|nr:hypothetical protein [Streptomyces radicis]